MILRIERQAGVPGNPRLFDHAPVARRGTLDASLNGVDGWPPLTSGREEGMVRLLGSRNTRFFRLSSEIPVLTGQPRGCVLKQQRDGTGHFALRRWTITP